MKLVFLLLLAFLGAVLMAAEAARITDNLVLEYTFPKASCQTAVGGPFPSSAASALSTNPAVTLFSGTTAASKSFDCPSFTKDSVIFSNAYNGIATRGGAAGSLGSGFKTSAAIDPAFVLNTDATYEFWFVMKESDTTAQANTVLLELALDTNEAPTPPNWVLGANFHLQISFGNVNSVKILGSFAGADHLAVFGISPPMVAPVLGSLNHLVITQEYLEATPSTPSATRFRFYINGITDGSFSSVIGDYTLPSTSEHLIIGGSYGVKANVGIRNSQKDFLLFALYSSTFSASDVSNNFAAGLANNAPVSGTTTEQKKEDIDLSFDPYSGFFDFETQFSSTLGLASNELTYTVNTLPTAGTITDDGVTFLAVNDQFTTTLNYSQSVPNADNTLDTLKLTVADAEFTSSVGTINIQYNQENDPPTALDTVLNIPEFQFKIVTISCSDPLDFGAIASNGAGKIPNFLPAIVQVINTTNDHGEFVFCDNTTTTISPGDEFSVTKGTNGVFSTTEVCYQAEGNTTLDGDAFIGSDFLMFFAFDGVGARSTNIGTATTNVLSALSTGCSDIDIAVNDCVEVFEEVDADPATTPTSYSFDLQGIDNRCLAAPDDPLCTSGERTIVWVVTGVPPASQGVFKASIGGTDVSITAAAIQSGINAGSGGFELEGQTIKFFPARNYFNLAHYPLCGSVSADALSTCADQTALGNSLPCFGPFCSDLKLTSDNAIGIIGDCNLADGTPNVNQTCPVQLNYTIRVGNGFAPASDGPTHLVYISNTMQNDLDFVSGQARDRLVTGGSYGPFKKNTLTFISSSNPIQLNDPDVDVKNLKVTVVNAGDTSPLKINGTILNEFTNNRFFLEVSPNCLFNGCVQEAAIFTGAQTLINILLDKMTITFTGNNNVTLVVSVFVPFSSSSTTNVETHNLLLIIEALGDAPDDSFFKQAPFYAICAAVGIALIMCCISCSRFCGRKTYGGFRMAKRARKMMIRRKIGGADDDDDKDSKADLDEIKKKLNMETRGKVLQVQTTTQILVLLSAICPCCCYLTHERRRELERGLDIDLEKDEMEDALENRLHEDIMAKKKPRTKNDELEIAFETANGEALMNWTKHHFVDPKTGEKREYFYNKVTDKSQWHSPFDGKPARGERKAPGAVSEGEESPKPKRFQARPPPKPKPASKKMDVSL